MELLIIKCANDYVRVVDDTTYVLGGLDKASVFPLEKLDRVQSHVEKLREKGFRKASIYRLILREEPYGPDAGHPSLQGSKGAK